MVPPLSTVVPPFFLLWSLRGSFVSYFGPYMILTLVPLLVPPLFSTFVPTLVLPMVPLVVPPLFPTLVSYFGSYSVSSCYSSFVSYIGQSCVSFFRSCFGSYFGSSFGFSFTSSFVSSFSSHLEQKTHHLYLIHKRWISRLPDDFVFVSPFAPLIFSIYFFQPGASSSLLPVNCT